jgi:hypothetical protein
MRLDYLIDRLLDSLAQERLLLRRVTRYLLPLLLLPVGFALAQMVRGWVGLLAGGLSAAVLLAQIELFLRPTMVRARLIDRDMTFYLNLAPNNVEPNLAPVVPLLIPSALTLASSMAIFLPTILASSPAWQRLAAIALGLGTLWTIWQRLAQVTSLLDSIERRLSATRINLVAADRRPTTNDEAGNVRPSSPALSGVEGFVLRRTGRAIDTAAPQDGLLEPAISQRMAGLPMPVLAISPAARALLRVEAYLLLRDFPGMAERDLLDALAGLAHQAQQDELRHWLLPPIGGKLYLPVAANGTLAHMLGAAARRLGMDGGFSASLGTWLVRLPPARSHAVAGRLIDALITLGLPPAGAILPHHLTVQGDLGQDSKLLSLLHLAATPLLFAERPGHAQGDDRPFIMRGGGVLDDMGGRGRHSGPRTDFVDGFIFVRTPGMDSVEQLTAHTINLRLKQVLAFGLLADARPYNRRAPIERSAALAYGRLRFDLRALLAGYNLEKALDVPWLDGRWSEIWPLILRMSDLKERDHSFLDAAQRLRDTALHELEQLAIAATKESQRI